MKHAVSKDARKPADMQQKGKVEGHKPCRTSKEAAVMFGYANQGCG